MTDQTPTTPMAGNWPTGAAVWLAITRPYPVTWPMVILVSLVPFYLVIARMSRQGPTHRPELPLDRVLPLLPEWAPIYGALYLFLIILPVFLVQRQETVRRTVWAYILVWTAGYAGFLLYPTVAPRPDAVAGDGFAAWGLRFLYEADPPYNCFPSIHVAHSFVSALACGRVHRTVGRVAMGCAALVALSTLFTKQHYVVDVIAGTLLAFAAYALLLRNGPRAAVPEDDHRVAPALALCVSALVACAVGISWVAYQMGLHP